jgi:hypothetical protein
MCAQDHPVERLEALLTRQSALRRVATLVAADPDPGRVFACVCEELGRVLGVNSTDMLRFEENGPATVVGCWAASGAPSFPVGASIPVEGQTVTGKLYRSGRPERVDDYTGVGGELAERLRTFGIRSAVGAPVKVSGKLWGAIMAVSGDPYAFPDGTEEPTGSTRVAGGSPRTSTTRSPSEGASGHPPTFAGFRRLQNFAFGGANVHEWRAIAASPGRSGATHHPARKGWPLRSAPRHPSEADPPPHRLAQPPRRRPHATPCRQYGEHCLLLYWSAMDCKYEVPMIPVSDVDRAKEFYAERLGFAVDVDHRAGESFRSCS